MFFNNPRADQFEVIIPNDFFDKTLCAPYNRYINDLNGPFETMIDVLNESLQSFSLPGYGYDPVTQTALSTLSSTGNLTPYENFFRPGGSLVDKVESKELDIQFRMLDGYINYFFMLEHLYYWYGLNNSDKTSMDILPITIKNSSGLPMTNIVFNNLMFLGITGIELGYDKVPRDFGTFTCKFRFDTMKFDYGFNFKKTTNVIVKTDGNA